MNENTAIEPVPGETCRVVAAEDLRDATDAGWVLRGVITDEVSTVLVEPMSPTEKEAERLARVSTGNYGISRVIGEHHARYSIPEGFNARQILAKRVRFVVCRPEGSALAEWSKKYENACEAGRISVIAEEEANRKLRKAEETLAAKNDQIVSHERELTRLRDAARWQHDRANTLERDIGKIREAIGSQRMTEILGPKKS